MSGALAQQALLSKLDEASQDPAGHDFRQVLKEAIDVTKLDHLEVARLVKVSTPTIQRWLDGVSTPSRFAMSPIYMAFARHIRHQTP